MASSILPHLSTRMDDNTLLPGRCSKEEVELYKRFTLGRRDIDNVPPLSARDLQLVGFCIGCAVALLAARQVLFQLFSDPRPSPTELAFVFRAVDTVRLSRHAACASSLMMLSIQMLPASRCLRAMNLGEERVVAHTRLSFGIRRFAEWCVRTLGRPVDPFINALRERWMAPALVAMRVERHLYNASAEFEGASARLEADRHADITAHGLKPCALPPVYRRASFLSWSENLNVKMQCVRHPLFRCRRKKNAMY